MHEFIKKLLAEEDAFHLQLRLPGGWFMTGAVAALTADAVTLSDVQQFHATEHYINPAGDLMCFNLSQIVYAVPVYG